MFCRLVCDAMAWIKVKVGICMLDVFGKKLELGRIPGSWQGCTPESLFMVCNVKSSVKMYENGVITIWWSNGVSKCV